MCQNERVECRLGSRLEGRAHGSADWEAHKPTLAESRTRFAFRWRRAVSAMPAGCQRHHQVVGLPVRGQWPANLVRPRECAAAYIESHQPSWRSARYAQQWARSLATHVYPIMGRTLVSDIDTPLVMRVLQPIWCTKTETAARLRERIELILDWAAVLGYRTGANPARWRGHLDHLLPSRFKTTPVKHHPALAYRELPTFMAELRRREAVAARCLEFTILTGCRSAEAVGAPWSEVDFGACVWTLPRERTKAFREHRIPLSDAAMSVLAQMPREGEYIFAGERGRPRLRCGNCFCGWGGEISRRTVSAVHFEPGQGKRRYSNGRLLRRP
jgi:integrase